MHRNYILLFNWIPTYQYLYKNKYLIQAYIDYEHCYRPIILINNKAYQSTCRKGYIKVLDRNEQSFSNLHPILLLANVLAVLTSYHSSLRSSLTLHLPIFFLVFLQVYFFLPFQSLRSSTLIYTMHMTTPPPISDFTSFLCDVFERTCKDVPATPLLILSSHLVLLLIPVIIISPHVRYLKIMIHPPSLILMNLEKVHRKRTCTRARC